MSGFKKTLLIVSLAALPIISYAATTQSIGVVDIQKALLQSKAAQDYAKLSQKLYQPKLDSLATQRDKIKLQDDKLQKNSLTLSKTELKKQQSSLEKEKHAFLQKLQALRQEKSQADQTELKNLEPDLQKAVSAVAKKDNYTLILDKSAILYQQNNIDLTDKVIAQLNTIAKTGKSKNNN